MQQYFLGLNVLKYCLFHPDVNEFMFMELSLLIGYKLTEHLSWLTFIIYIVFHWGFNKSGGMHTLVRQ